MNRFFTFVGLATLTYSFSACTCDCSKQKPPQDKDSAVLNAPSRTAEASFFTNMRQKAGNVADIKRKAMSVGDLPQGLTLSAILLENTKDRNDEESSALVMTVLNALLKAEGKENQLDMEFSMSDKPVEDGVFLFSLQTAEDFKGTQQLILQMFNEEGFEMVAHNQFQITQGNNYKALSVKDFSSGTYIFRLSDGSNRELLRRVEIQNNTDVAH